MRRNVSSHFLRAPRTIGPRSLDQPTGWPTSWSINSDNGDENNQHRSGYTQAGTCTPTNGPTERPNGTASQIPSVVCPSLPYDAAPDCCNDYDCGDDRPNTTTNLATATSDHWKRRVTVCRISFKAMPQVVSRAGERNTVWMSIEYLIESSGQTKS